MTIRKQIIEILKENPQGLTCGELVQHCTARGIPQKHTTMSVHLTALQRSGRVTGVQDTGVRRRYFAATNGKTRVVVETPPAAAPETNSRPSVNLSFEALIDQVAHSLVQAVGDRIEQALRSQLQSRVQLALQSLPAQLQLPAPAPHTAQEALTDLLDSVPPTPEPTHRPPAKAAAPARPRVVIFGLLDGQAAMIHNEYHKALDLRFVRSDASGSARAKELAASADVVLSMVGFISHSTEDMIRSRGANLERVSGGMSALRKCLNQLAGKEASHD